MVETGTTGTGNVADRKPYDPNAKKNHLPLILVGVTLVGAAIAAGLIVGLSGRISERNEYVQKACDEDRPTALDINVCLQADCYFDTSTCEIECPFGFKGDGDCETSCDCAFEGVYQGDIKFGRDGLSRMAEAYGMTGGASGESDFAVFSGSSVVKEKLWNQFPDNGRYKVYYEIKDEIPNESTGALLQAIEFFGQNTCIDFSLRHEDEMPFFIFGTGDGCSSAIGYASYMQDQTVSLDEGCFTQETIKHQLLHLLGFEHEQSRPDRDSHVRVMEENILPNKVADFKKLSKDQIGGLTSAYDLKSILHFGSKSFSRNGKNTIVLRESGDIIPQATDASDLDIEEVNLLYGCLDKSPGEWSMWDEWGTCDASCGTGSQSRFRRCEDAAAKLVDSCEGSSKEFKECDIGVPCEVSESKGEVAGLEPIGECDVECGGGRTLAKFICDPPESKCGNEGLLYLPCNEEPCLTKTEEFHLWKKWGKWSKCSSTCGGGTRRRSRRCLSGGQSSSQCTMQDGAKASIEFHKEPCETDACVGGPPEDEGSWVAWESCSATCDGIRLRFKLCVLQNECEKADNCQSEPCNTDVCQAQGPQALSTEAVDVSGPLCPPSPDNMWRFGDFNGDGRKDPLCAHGSEDIALAHTDPQGAVEKVFWEGSRRECIGHIHVGDFDGDGKADMLCRDLNLGKLVILLAARDGGFDGKVVEIVADFCSFATHKVILMDANGDGKTDILCHMDDKRACLRLSTL